MTTPNSSTPATPTAPAAAAPAASAQPAAAPTGDKPGGEPAAPAPSAKPPLSESERRAIIENTKLKRELAEERKRGEASAKDVAALQRIRDPKTRWEAAQELGLTYESYTEYVLKGMGKKEPEPVALPPEVTEKLKRLDELSEKDKAAEEARAKAEQKKQYDDNVGKVKEFVTTNAEALPMTAALEQHEDMLRTFLQETAANEGVPPDDQDFAARYEKRLADQVEKQLTAIAATSKGKALLQRLLGVPDAQPANPKRADTTSAAPKTRSITNGLSAETPPAADPRTLPPTELQKRAARHFAS